MRINSGTELGGTQTTDRVTPAGNRLSAITMDHRRNKVGITMIPVLSGTTRVVERIP